MKRLLDIFLSFLGLFILSPILLVFMFLVYQQDKHSPFYVASRVGLNGKIFKMYKLRSMCIDADKSGVDSTSGDDTRITPIGHKIRKYKLDEIVQLWNVLVGDMSMVGPRPNVLSDTNLYTKIEKGLLKVKPGITDFSSIIFSDEGEILKGKEDPDLSYNQLIRPWKSRLGLIYIQNSSLLLDIKLIYYTVVAIISKQNAINWISVQLKLLNAEPSLINICKRKIELYPYPPPGTNQIVQSRKI